MEVIIANSRGEAETLAANIFKKLLRDKPECVLGLATGGTPLGLYDKLVDAFEKGEADFSKVRTFNLDEYIGIPPENPASYHAFMRENLFSRVNIPAENVKIPDGMAENLHAFCRHYESLIKGAGGIDLQLLGIGSTGHIGFNEPCSSFASRTRVKTLARRTLEDNARFFGGDVGSVPPHVITMGIGTILESRMAVLMAFGECKADIIAKTVEGPLDARVPASALHLHPNAKVILDEAAASRLQDADYYKWVYANKPDWQV